MNKNSAIKIDDSIPLPDARRGGGRKAKYPLQLMTVGQSFFAPGVTSAKMCGSVSFATRKTGAIFATRTVTEDGVCGVRVWRVA